ncbi:MAG: hypothetical protein WC516_08120 [Patescibacteria group bacterium]|jgi:hypothetical protein
MIGYKPYRTYKTKAIARSVMEKLRKQGNRVTAREITLKGKGVRVRVFVKEKENGRNVCTL